MYQTVQKLLVGDTQIAILEWSRPPLMPSPQYKFLYLSTNRFKRCTHYRSLNVRHYGIVETARVKIVESRSPSMISPPHKISSKFTSRFKRCARSEV
jgi:hypothetical protein